MDAISMIVGIAVGVFIGGVIGYTMGGDSERGKWEGFRSDLEERERKLIIKEHEFSQRTGKDERSKPSPWVERP